MRRPNWGILSIWLKKEGFEQGFEESFKQGLEEGKLLEKEETARRLYKQTILDGRANCRSYIFRASSSRAYYQRIR